MERSEYVELLKLAAKKTKGSQLPGHKHNFEVMRLDLLCHRPPRAATVNYINSFIAQYGTNAQQ